jgi:hypothetical protein
MSETLLEISSKNGVLSDGNNSTFKTVFGEPIRVSAGSTINFTNAFIDLGLESADLIAVPYNLRLGISFFRYDQDGPKVSSTVGTDPEIYEKAPMYFGLADTIVEDFDYAFDKGFSNVNLGFRVSTYSPTNLPSFLCERTARSNPQEGTVNETFNAVEETASIDIPAGFYSRSKFIQLVNDGFNLINGSVTNQDKPLENVTAHAPTVAAPYRNTVTPYDYQLAPNNNSQILKSFEYSYATWSPTAADGSDDTAPGTGADTIIHPSDKVWNYWFFPMYSIPSNPALFIDEVYLPYVWMTDQQTGFLAGTTKFNLNYDQDNQLFFIDYLHSPILDTNQREIVQFSRQKTAYGKAAGVSFQPTGYKSNGRMGGIMLSRMFSLELDATFTPVSNDNTNFWQKYLGFGFDDDFHTQFIADLETTARTFYYNKVFDNNPLSKTSVIYNHSIIHPALKYFDTCTTDALVPVQWLQQQNYTTPADDYGFSIFVRDIPKSFQSIGNRNILGTGGQFVEPDAFFLVEVNINGARTDNYRDKDSYRQIMAVCGKTYPSTASYIQSFDDNVVQSIVMTEDITIDTIEVRLLRPDKTPALELGANSTVFLKLVQPIQVQAPQPQ